MAVTAAAVKPPALTEAQFQQQVVDLAKLFGWGTSYNSRRDKGAPDWPLAGLVFHPRIMYRSEPGWPDLTLIRRSDRRLIFAELKTDKGKLSPRQQQVLDLLRCLGVDTVGRFIGVKNDVRWVPDAGPRIEVFVWKPADFPQIAEILR